MTNALGSHKLNLLRRDRMDPRKTFRFFDDFVSVSIDDTTSDLTSWELVEDAGSVQAAADKRGGWLSLTTVGTDNREVYVASRGQAFIFNTTDELFFECEVQNTAVGATGDATFILGLSDTVGANSIVDAGTTMTSFDGAVFTLEENADVAFVTSNAATQVRTAAAHTWTDGDLVRLGFYYDPCVQANGTTAQIIPVVNGVEGTNHTITIAGLEEMNILIGAKTHSNNAQVVEVDWVEVLQRRNAGGDIDDLQV